MSSNDEATCNGYQVNGQLHHGGYCPVHGDNCSCCGMPEAGHNQAACDEAMRNWQPTGILGLAMSSNDEAALRALAGANFGPDAQLILPSGRKLDGDEAQAMTSLYAPPADGEPERCAAFLGDIRAEGGTRALERVRCDRAAGHDGTHSGTTAWTE